MRKPVNCIAFALLAFAIGVATPALAQAPLRIGASLSQTGQYAALGQNQLRGYQICLKQANEKGGVRAGKLELVSEDDQSQAARAAGIYEKLITQNKVDAILGPYASDITEAVANVSEKHRMPMVAANAAATSIFRKGRRNRIPCIDVNASKRVDRIDQRYRIRSAPNGRFGSGRNVCNIRRKLNDNRRSAQPP